jgi:type II secretory pathway component PulF
MGSFTHSLNHALLGLFALALAALILPPTRRWLGSRLPGFKDARLAQIAQSFHLLLQSGCPLPESIRLVRELETNTPAASELARWETRIQGGITRLAEVSRPDAQHPSKAIPPFFRWLVLSTGDRVADGFGRAAAHYSERARHRMDILVTGLAPGAVLALGFLIVLNFLPAFLGLVTMIDKLGGGE